MKKIKLLLPVILLTAVFITSCQPKVDLKKEKEDILKYLEKANKANMEKDLEAWLSLYADSCVYPGNGKIYHYTKEDIKKNMEKVYSNKNHRVSSIDELEKPIIHVSDDASMAWYIVNMRFIIVNKDSIGNERTDSATLSSLYVLEKKNSIWAEVTGVDTYKPKKGK